MEYSRYFEDLPKPRYPSHANSRDKESLNSLQPKRSHARGAKHEEQHRQGAVSAALPSDYITTPVALVQHCSSRGAVTEEQQACSSSREAEEHLSGMCVMQHISITQ